MGKKVYDIPFAAILEAYEDCIRNKKSSLQCIEFSVNAESALVELHKDLCNATYQPDKSTCFIVTHPVRREIIASSFRDRVVHHFIKLRMNPLYEEWYHECGNVSKNCRKGEGPQSAVEEFSEMIRFQSNDYTRNCWVLLLDIHSYFMSIDKSILWEMMEQFIRDKYKGGDIEPLLWLARITAFHSPQRNCRFISPRSAWDPLPKSKSLLQNDDNIGIAPGNLASQDEANFYLTPLDYFVVKVKGFRDYIRFMDDIRIVGDDLDALKQLRWDIEEFLRDQLHLRLHPKKVQVLHYSKGIPFVGHIVKPGRTYISNRIFGHLYDTIAKYNRIAQQGGAERYAEKFVASMNSYWGMMRHTNSYGRRMKSYKLIDPIWYKYVYVTAQCTKMVLRNRYKPKHNALKRIKQKDYGRIFTPEMFE